jgi:hypothetical protein
MQSIKRVIKALLVGACLGALLGALELGAATWFDPRQGYLGSSRPYTLLAMVLGAGIGLFAGALIGLLVGVMRASPGKGALIGLLGGAVLTLAVFASQPAAYDRIVSLALIPLGAIVGYGAAWGAGGGRPGMGDG